MSRSIEISDEYDQILILSFMEDRIFSLSQYDPEGKFVDSFSFVLQLGANFVCLCQLRAECYGVRWEPELNDHVRYKVIPSKYRSLYVLAPVGVPRLDEFRPRRKVSIDDVNYDAPRLLDLVATYLLTNGVGRKEVAAVRPGLIWAMFGVVEIKVNMEEPERREEVPMCPYSFHTWENYVLDYERYEKSA